MKGILLMANWKSNIWPYTKNKRSVQKCIICICCISTYVCLFGTVSFPMCDSGFPNGTTRSIYLGQSTLAKKGWDLISSTPPTPAPSLSIGLYWSSFVIRQDRQTRNINYTLLLDKLSHGELKFAYLQEETDKWELNTSQKNVHNLYSYWV